MIASLALAAVAAAPALVRAGATIDPNKPLPFHSEPGQVGYNNCSTTDSAKSMCQTAWFNSIEDFCMWGPPTVDSIGNTEERVVAYCTKKGHGARLIPPGAITGVQWLATPYFFQVTGVGDMTKINIKKGDAGGELDPHGANGVGNPIGGLVLKKQKSGKNIQFLEWHNFIGASVFSFRACRPGTGHEAAWCPHIYDEMGCYWNDPARYDKGYYQHCNAATGLQPGVYGGSTFHQGDGNTPSAHPAPASSNCVSVKAPGANYGPMVPAGAKRMDHQAREARPTPHAVRKDEI